MLCKNFGEAMDFLGVVAIIIIVVTVGLGIITIAPYFGWFHWEWFKPIPAWSIWILLLVIGLWYIGNDGDERGIHRR